MKKTILAGIVACMLLAISNPPMLFAATEVDEPDMPYDFSDAAKWPKIHTDSCVPSKKEYRSTAYARITSDNKIEYVLETSLEGIIFRYEYAKIDKSRPDFGFGFIRTENGWMRFNLMTETYSNMLDQYLINHGELELSHANACYHAMISKFEQFWNELFKETGAR